MKIDVGKFIDCLVISSHRKPASGNVTWTSLSMQTWERSFTFALRSSLTSADFSTTWDSSRSKRPWWTWLLEVLPLNPLSRTTTIWICSCSWESLPNCISRWIHDCRNDILRHSRVYNYAPSKLSFFRCLWLAASIEFTKLDDNFVTKASIWRTTQNSQRASSIWHTPTTTIWWMSRKPWLPVKHIHYIYCLANIAAHY